MSLRRVFEPINVGGVAIPNRITRTAHTTNIGSGTIDDHLIAYHEARARGGVGLTILEILSVHPTSPATLNLGDANLKKGYERLLSAVRPHGMKVFQQLWHAGHNVMPLDGSPPWSASDVIGPYCGSVPLPMTQPMIDEVIDGYTAAAKLCADSGLDGVEIHCAHGYLPQQFLSSNSNKRTDRYGGSLENRMRFALEILRSIRKSVSGDFAVGVRLSPDLVVGGVDAHDNARVLECMQKEALVDFVNVSVGSYQHIEKTTGGMHEPTGYQIADTAPIVAAAKVPVIVAGRIGSLDDAEQLLREGKAHLVGMTRATIADPDIVRKSREGHGAEVRPCIGCNQGCVGGLMGPRRRMGCTVNAAVGFEQTLSEDKLDRVAVPRSIVVIGGGPAGLEAARIAALRGHKVRLFEALPDLGGNLNVALRAPWRHNIGDIAKWLEREVYRLGVSISLSTFADSSDVLSCKPDAVIVATGSEPRMDGIQRWNPGELPSGIDAPHVVSSTDVMLGDIPGSVRRAVVLDDLGHYEGIGVAEHLLARSIAVTMVTPLYAAAPLMEASFTIQPALERLGKHDFSLMTRTRLIGVRTDEVDVVSIFDAKVQTLDADLVVLVTPNRPRRALYDELSRESVRCLIAGDAMSPRFLEVAIAEGNAAGRAV